MVNPFKFVEDMLWSEWFWLPPGHNWTTHASTSTKNYADFYWIYFPIPFSLVIFLFRILFERYVCAPLGQSMGIRDTRPRPPQSNQIFEKEYRRMRKLPSPERVQALSKQSAWTMRSIERWFRQRKAQDNLSQLQKFTETGWRFFYYSVVFAYGLVTVSQKPWFRSTLYCWIGYPFQEVDGDMFWYYMVELAFYWSLLISQFFDVKRKDFWQMFTHHVTTILLMSLSWIVNLVRMGSLVLLIHDVADVFLEAAKLARYANRPRLCDAIFAVFTLVWIGSRLIVYPYVVLRAGLFEACETVKPDVECFPAYYVFNGLLVILQVLHILWTYYIVRIAIKSIRTGNTDDARSDTDEDMEGENDKVVGVEETTTEPAHSSLQRTMFNKPSANGLKQRGTGVCS